MSGTVENTSSHSHSVYPCLVEQAEQTSEAVDSVAQQVFHVHLDTTQGDVLMEVHRDWAPIRAARFEELVKAHFFDNSPIFRVIPSFVAQFGISGDPVLSDRWKNATIKADPIVGRSNEYGAVAYGLDFKEGTKEMDPDSATTQVYINLGDNARLDANFAPFAQVVKGMEVVEKFYSEYGDDMDGGSGPSQERIESEGNAYVEEFFPKLDRILSARIVSKPE